MEPSNLNDPICLCLGLSGGLEEFMLWSGSWCGMPWLAGLAGTCVCNASATWDLKVCVALRISFLFCFHIGWAGLAEEILMIRY